MKTMNNIIIITLFNNDDNTRLRNDNKHINKMNVNYIQARRSLYEYKIVL